MAKVLFGAMMVDARNKLGGQVFSKNKAGSFIRRKVSPAQPRTAAQSAIRAGLTSLAKAWGGTLTADQRSAWTAFAKNTPSRDQFGNAVQLTGEQLFIKLNNAILYAGATLIADPPLSLVVPSISGMAPSAVAATPLIEIATPVPHPLLVTQLYMVYATPQVSPGKTSISSLYSFVEKFAGTATAPFDITTTYTAKYGALEAGRLIGVGIRILDSLTGAQSPIFSQNIIVT